MLELAKYVEPGDLILREHRWRPVTSVREDDGYVFINYAKGHGDYEAGFGGWSVSRLYDKVRIRRGQLD